MRLELITIYTFQKHLMINIKFSNKGIMYIYEVVRPWPF